MTSSYRLAPDLGRPVPVHAQTEAAESARRAIRHRRARNVELVTKHERPHSEAVPANAAKLKAQADAAGFETVLTFGHWTSNAGKSNETRDESVTVQGQHKARREGFAAVWVKGRARMGLWYDAAHRAGDDVGITEVGKRV